MAVLQVNADELELLVRGEPRQPARDPRPAPARRRRDGARLQAAGQDRPGDRTTARRARRAASTWTTSTRASGSACCPWPTCRTTGSRSTTAQGATTRRRPVPLPAHARRDRPAPDQRGPPRAAVDGARRARAPLRRPRTAPVDRHVLRGLGAERPGRPGRRRLQQLGRPRAPDAPARAPRASGSCSCPTSARGTDVQVRRSSAPTAQWREKADPMAFHTEVPPATVVGGLRVGVHVGRRRLDGPTAADAAGRARARCRSTRCTSARGEARGGDATPTQQLADELVAVRRRPRLHPRRAAAGDGAPVRRLVGLPGHVVLRARPRASATPTASGCSSTGCTRPASA